MRSTWNNGWRVFSLIVFLVVCLLHPCRISARESIVSGVTVIYERYEYGEPGHDPFSRGGEPGGNEERNGDSGHGAESMPPGSDGSDNDQNPWPGSYRDVQDFFGSTCKEIVHWLKSLI